MARINKATRKSKDGTKEYQIEYKINSAGQLSEYRVRRGARGTWTKWFRTQNIGNLLDKLGFAKYVINLSHDFYFESYFGRGRISINKHILKRLADDKNIPSSELFASVLPWDGTYWGIPSSAVDTKPNFQYLESLFKEFDE